MSVIKIGFLFSLGIGLGAMVIRIINAASVVCLKRLLNIDKESDAVTGTKGYR